MKFYAVIDTNVVISAMLKKASLPAQIINEALAGNIIPVISEDIVCEYDEVLRRKKFRFPAEIVNDFIIQIKKRAILLNGIPVEENMPDKDDVIFYKVVMEARQTSDAYLVTGNQKHFPIKPYVVTPHEMIEIIRKSPEN